jgi:hypothetical protein
MDKLLEHLKQLQALVSGALPFMTTKVQIFPFLNPQIGKDLWPITSILALAASMLTYNLAQAFERRMGALALGLTGLVLAAAFLCFMEAIVVGIVPLSDPIVEDYLVRISFILIFIGIGLAFGWSFAGVLK